MAAKYIVGIDLGTSNCAVAFARFDDASGQVSDFPVIQLQRDAQLAPQPLLPSALYAPISSEAASLSLPWPNNSGWVTGAYARWRGAKVPGRLITSAKSWLCHPSVDRQAAILPWGGAADVEKISPVRASALLLGQMRDAWNQEHPADPLSAQEVVLTVPASFDEVARSLTVAAAREAGLEQFTLLEEPQAAFYQFSHRHQRDLAGILENIRLVLVVDVGGGTTDFTLVQVAASPEGPLLRRIAVGDHLILGGDNMDNALARRVEEKLQGRKLSTAQLIQVVQAAREAKETLLSEKAPAEAIITLAGEGSKLLGSTISVGLSQQEVKALVLDGFFPRNTPHDLPKKTARAGIQEMGLPYVAEPAITRHLAAFLAKHADSAFEALGQPAEARKGPPRPDAILLNGGVFNSPKLARRLVEVASSWWQDRPPIPLLAHDDLDLAVARGAAYYGLVRHGRGRRISGGTAHSFYAGVTDKNETPSAIALIPRGFEEGETIELKDRLFKLNIGRPVQFPIYTSTGDQVDRPGDVVRVTDALTPLPPIQTVLKSSKNRAEKIPIYLRARLTEIGTVELWCAAAESNEQWRLEFDIRGSSSESVSVTESLPPRFSEARDYVAKIFGNRPSAVEKGPKDVKQLWSSLERLLGARETWTLPVLRQLWGELFAGAGKRRRSAEHERIFFQLLGYTLRPGFGYALDEWRCEQSFKLFGELLEFHKEKPNWNEFWILWRRVSGGLSLERQNEIWNYLKPNLAVRLVPHASKNTPRPKGSNPEGADEMVRAAATLEHLPAIEKRWLGDSICERLKELRPAGGPWAWSLGRLGARVPLYGSVHNVVAPDGIQNWIHLLLESETLDGRVFALAQLARKAGDRLRDVDDSTRAAILDALRRSKTSENTVQTVTEITELQSADEARAFGDSLPIGLQLTHASRE
ncbi:MAG TPA: Hsp70 family protein [Verrucomicrobiae bacterium]|jgi:molecular chaperone DnaK (HSP70)|nr:Hsp70 family protein [Verrucomicrobiae bacterium]